MIKEAPVIFSATETREEFFEAIYEEAFPSVARFVSRQGGSFEDAKDIFQDALVILYEKIVSGYEADVSYEAYLVGIAKHLWIRKFKEDHRKISLDTNEMSITIPEDYFEPAASNRLLILLELTGKRCLELLRAFYYDKVSLNDISKAFGFSGIHSATVQKYKCIEKMRNTIKEKAIRYEDLSE